MRKDNLRKMVRVLVEECGYENVRETLDRLAPIPENRTSTINRHVSGDNKRRTKPNALTTVKSLALDDEEKASVLTALAERYEGKTFMPNVNHVRAFLEREGEDVSNVKSRQQVTSTVFRYLSRWDTSKLRDLEASGVYGPPKSFSAIAKAIEGVGRRRRFADETRKKLFGESPSDIVR